MDFKVKSGRDEIINKLVFQNYDGAIIYESPQKGFDTDYAVKLSRDSIKKHGEQVKTYKGFYVTNKPA